MILYFLFYKNNSKNLVRNFHEITIQFNNFSDINYIYKQLGDVAKSLDILIVKHLINNKRKRNKPRSLRKAKI